MPLNQACSVEAYRENIATEIGAGKTPAQAAAIASDTLTQACETEGKPVPRTDGAEKGLHVRRYDAGEFRAPVRTPNGYLRCDARITRVGVFEYQSADGKTRRELRLPEEVFKDDSLATFDLVPLTNGHPKERLDARNTKRFAAGMVQGVRRVDDFVGAEVLITDEDAIKAAEGGKNQLSCGYNCDIDWLPGVTAGIPGVADGLHYDAIQRNIRGNHVALVERGRAGAEASLHLDTEDAVQVIAAAKSNPTGPKPGPVGGQVVMKKMTIDGIEFEMPEDAAQKLGDVLGQIQESGEALERNLAEAKARADQADEDLEKLKADVAERYSPEAIQALVKERVALETAAAKVLKDDGLDLSSMSEPEIQKAVVLKVSPGAETKLDSADDAYLAARFDAAIEAWKEAEKTKPKPSHAVRGAATVQHSDSRSARQKMIEEHCRMGREPIKAATN